MSDALDETSSALRHLPPGLRSAGEARGFVTEALRSWAVPEDVVEDIVLVTSELVTNALEHGHGAVDVAVRRIGDVVRLSVRDEADAEPVLRQLTESSPRGRGLAMVAAISAAWGYDPAAPGKWVWAEFRLH
ncbi:ATP-binding protein [Amycolatopsis acidicola]|uniref:ATP-binding protein n=1 Tax=Amycolatopsis acidicola TaxID=2596893 RepID=UPI0024420755|nr:ATP-binding protein [Amycolatopsis acidicola]